MLGMSTIGMTASRSTTLSASLPGRKLDKNVVYIKTFNIDGIYHYLGASNLTWTRRERKTSRELT